MPESAKEDMYEDPELMDNEIYDDEKESSVSATPAWLVSFAVHGLLAIIMMGIIFGQIEDEEPPPIRITQPAEIIIDKPVDDLVHKLDEVPVTIDTEVTDTPVVVTTLEIEVEDIEITDPVEMQDVAQNRPDAVSDAEMGGAMAFMAIGASGSAAGSKGMGGRGKPGKGRMPGNSPLADKAVDAALYWFKKHQNTDGADKGMWDVDGYMDMCQDGAKCEPGTAHTATGGDGDSACTAYALLCFLGAGHDHKVGKFKNTVKMAIDWLQANQREDGGFGKAGRNYENAVCTMAICEAYAMTMDPSLKQCAQRAVDNLLAKQSKTDAYPYGIGWNYSAASATRNDSSVTGWCVMALKAAKSAQLDVGNGWEGSKTWLDAAWKASNPGVDPASLGSDSTSTFCYTYNAVDDTAKGKRLECVGALCAVFLGKTKGDGVLDSMINTIMEKQVPQAYPCNTYYMYYNTLNMFQYGGEKWLDWNAQVRDLLVDAQHGNGTGCFNGSWDYEGTKFHGHETGRLLSTAYCCLSLEVYYRYDRVMEMKEKIKKAAGNK